LNEQKAETMRLAERERACQQAQATSALEVAQVREQHQRCEAEIKVLTTSLRQAEEEQRAAASLHAQDEAASLQKHEAMLAEHEAKVSALQATWEAKQEALLADVQGLTEALSRCKAACDELEAQNRDLQTKHRVVNEALSAMDASAAAARDQWREAQARLAELDQLRQENATLREEKVHAEASTRELATREDDARDARVQLAAAQAKLSDLERLLQENRTLRDEVADLRLHGEASVELERVPAEHKRLRLDAELMARRLQELLQDQTELADLRTRFHDLQSLGEEVAYLRRREKDLEAQLYASGSASPDDQPAVAGMPALHSVGTDMEASLRALVQPGGARSAVLADTQGFLIASAGEPMPQEGMAAFAAIASEMVARTRILLPLADVDSVRVRDTNRIVLSCRLFETGGQGLGVATLGPGEPSVPDADRAVNELAVAVAGKITDSDK
jgi:chromosome segregation ATPase